MTTIQQTTTTTNENSPIKQLREEVNGSLANTLANWTISPISKFFRGDKMEDAYARQKASNLANIEDAYSLARETSFGLERGRVEFSETQRVLLQASAPVAAPAATPVVAQVAAPAPTAEELVALMRAGLLVLPKIEETQVMDKLNPYKK